MIEKICPAPVSRMYGGPIKLECLLINNDLIFHTIFDQAAVGFAYIESRTGKLIKVNKKFCDIIGFKEKDASATTFMAITHPDDLKEDLDNMQKLLKGEQREFTIEKRYIRKDGSIVWGKLTVSALWAPGEKPDYHIAVVEDITERKRAEEQLKKLNKLLDQRVEERTTELQAKTIKLGETNRLLKKKELELRDKNKNLDELNTALKVLIQQKDESRVELEEKVLATMKKLVEPYLEKLARICPEAKQQNFITIINANLKEVISPFSLRLSSGSVNLSATELKVADFIKHGHSNKGIAESLNMSSQTVAAHRKHIRKKLAINNTKANLTSYLKTLA